jgi:DNA-binding CsgD family transcriptional regulator
VAVDLLKQVGELDPSATSLLVGFSRLPTVAETLAAALSAHRDVRATAEVHGRAEGRASASRTLTRRELEVLRLAAAGNSNSEVAKMLWLSRETVKFHLANTYRKLGVRDRHAAAHAAAERGLLYALPLVDSAAPEKLRK